MNKLEFIEVEPIGQKMLVYLGDSTKMHKILNKDKEKSKWLRKQVKKIGFDENSAGGLYYRNDNKRPFLLFIDTHQKKEALNETIMHELVHLVDRLSEYYLFETEKEFRAYLFESLYRKIKKLI